MRAAWVLVFLVGCGQTNLDVVDLTPTTLSSGLVAHWTFDQTEGPELEDSSGNRRNGIISGATFRTDGHFGSALHFLPGDGVTVENFPYATPSWAFSAWVRIGADDVVSDDFGSVVNTEVLGESGWQFQTRGCSSGIYWNLTYWNQRYLAYDCPCFELGRWSHATVVRDAMANLLTFYLDGLVVKSIASPPPILAGTSSLYMGKWIGPGRLFSGSVDDVTIYDRALTAAEVEELHTRPAPPRR